MGGVLVKPQNQESLRSGLRTPVNRQDSLGFVGPGSERVVFLGRSQGRNRLAEVDQGAVPAEEGIPSRLPRDRGLQPGTLKRGRILRIGNLPPPKGGELRQAPLADRLDQRRVAVFDEVLERRRLSLLLAHEQKRNIGSEQD